ncbi:ABC1 kinase family protein [Robertmurraya kyonggiensis]|uniref:AarF/ABC1/UbiB kinase family protein n=1 Tax=Robertmurraya kyonggiensis TaxID=1037680 RepID=A0A4U1DBB4_9BACI|nr:AarF/UbiB family protein [Robertmurraya kyonggiensis]TKC18897.1 AarF/ABC1/UbiB kinase family protein [Robertmurraya kyonggiensis]
MKTNRFVRMGKILKLAFGIIFQIYRYKITKKPKSEWDKLWSEIGERFRNTLFELEGLLIKIGQILSTRADLLPESFIKQIEDLTDHVPPSTWNEIEHVLESEWGGPVQELLQSIEEEAVASASIGEVYKGILKSGKQVAIKVQRPNIQSIIQTDFHTFKIIIWLIDLLVPVPKGFINFKVLYRELKQVIERELDFNIELQTQIYFSERFKDNSYVVIPSVYPELSTSKVLVMDWVIGERITNDDALLEMGVKRDVLVKHLLEIFLPQWLEPGTFHADPHPGNMLVTKKGKIILLDYGMVGDISKQDANCFQELIENVLSKNYGKAVECLRTLGFLLPEADARVIEKFLGEMASFQLSQLKAADIFALKKEMYEMVQVLPIQVPTRFVFLGRAFVTVEGIIQHLAPDGDLVEIAKPIFIKWLNQQGNAKWAFAWRWVQSQPLFKIFHTVTDFLNMPRKLEAMKEVEQRRHFQFQIYESRKKSLFQLLLLGTVGTGVGIYLTHSIITQFSVGILVVSGFGYIIAHIRQKKWMKYMPNKHR